MKKILYWLGIRKRPLKGFRFWRGVFWIVDPDTKKVHTEQVEIHSVDPVEDPWHLEIQIKRTLPIILKDGFMVVDVMIPRKEYWTMTFKVKRDK